MGVKIQLFDVGAYRLDFCLWGWMKSELYEAKVNTRDELVARITNSAALIKQERQDDLRRITRGLKSALKSIVEFLNIYFELLQFIEIIYITNKCNQYVIFLSFISYVRLFMRNNQRAVSPHSFKTGHMFMWTYLLGTVHPTTSQNIYNSSWNTLYILLWRKKSLNVI